MLRPTKKPLCCDGSEHNRRNVAQKEKRTGMHVCAGAPVCAEILKKCNSSNASLGHKRNSGTRDVFINFEISRRTNQLSKLLFLRIALKLSSLNPFLVSLSQHSKYASRRSPGDVGIRRAFNKDASTSTTLKGHQLLPRPSKTTLPQFPGFHHGVHSRSGTHRNYEGGQRRPGQHFGQAEYVQLCELLSTASSSTAFGFVKTTTTPETQKKVVVNGAHSS